MKAEFGKPDKAGEKAALPRFSTQCSQLPVPPQEVSWNRNPPGEQQLWLQPSAAVHSVARGCFHYTNTCTLTHKCTHPWNTHTPTLQANKTRQLWWIYEAAFALRPNRRCLPCWKTTGSQAHILKLNFSQDSLCRSEIHWIHWKCSLRWKCIWLSFSFTSW